MADSTTNIANDGLDHALWFGLAVESAGRFGAHCGKNVVARRKADKECKRDKPHAEPKVGRDHGKGRHVGSFIVG